MKTTQINEVTEGSHYYMVRYDSTVFLARKGPVYATESPLGEHEQVIKDLCELVMSYEIGDRVAGDND